MFDKQEFDIPGEEDIPDIIQYIQEHPNDPIPYLMQQYNCTQQTIMNIVMKGSAE